MLERLRGETDRAGLLRRARQWTARVRPFQQRVVSGKSRQYIDCACDRGGRTPKSERFSNMIGLILIAAAVLVFAVLLLQPKIGTVLVWPIVFAYPHLFVERQQLTPWNVGMDDVFICIFFVAVVVRRGFFGKTELRFGLAMRGTVI